MNSDVTFLLPNWSVWVFSFSGLLFPKTDRCNKYIQLVVAALLHGIFLFIFLTGFSQINSFWRYSFGKNVIRSIRLTEALSIIIRFLWNIGHISQYELLINHLSYYHNVLKQNSCKNLKAQKFGFFLMANSVVVIMMNAGLGENKLFGNSRNSYFWLIVLFKQSIGCEFLAMFWGKIQGLFMIINEKIVKEYHQAMNISKIKRITKNNERQERLDHELQEKIFNLKKLSELHYELSNSIMNFNYITSFDLVVWMMSNFIASVTIAFLVISSVLSRRYSAIVYFWWLFSQLYTTYYITCAWSSVSSEANRTSILLHDVWNGCVKTEQLQQKLRYLQFLSMRFLITKMKFSVYGFFPLDKTLFYSIVSAASTYIIILLQLQ